MREQVFETWSCIRSKSEISQIKTFLTLSLPQAIIIGFHKQHRTLRINFFSSNSLLKKGKIR